MKTIIYIRHGEDENGKHVNDQELTESGKHESYLLAKQLIATFGIPNIIYYSPLFRCRQTIKQMKKAINEIVNSSNKDTIIYKVEPKLGRFFTKKEIKNVDIRRSTIKNGVIIYEKHEKFKERVKEHLTNILTDDNNHIIWNITHALVFLNTARITNTPHKEHVKSSDFIIIKTDL